jgi:hypothetical protein
MSEGAGDTNAWGKTLQSANEMTEELRAAGWQVVTVRAPHTAPEAPADGDTDRFGYTYIAPGDVETAFRSAAEDGEFDSYEVRSRTVGNSHFLLTRVADTDRRVVVLLVGAVPVSEVDDLARVAAEAGEMYSHVELLDGTHLGTFHHDDPTPFFPEAAR